MPQIAPPAPPQPAPEPDPQPASAGPDEPQGADGGNADAAGAAPDTGVPDSPAEELSYSTGTGELPAQELIVRGPCQINLVSYPPVPVQSAEDLKKFPNGPGVYIISVNGKPWYVGMAINQIRERFLHRLKALRDFNVPLQALAGRSVSFVLLHGKTLPACSITGRSGATNRGGTSSPERTLTGVEGTLRIVEQFYIKKLQTNAAGRGNHRSEQVIVDGNQGLSINVKSIADGSTKRHSIQPKRTQTS